MPDNATFDHDLGLAWSESRSGQATAALKRLQAIRDVLGSDPDPAIQWRCEWLTAWALFLLGEPETGIKHSQKARELSVTLDVPARAKSAALNGRMLCVLQLNDEAYSEALEAVKLAEQCDDYWVRAMSLSVLAISVSQGGDLDSALTYNHRALTIAKDIGDTHLLSSIQVSLGLIHADLADDAQESGDEIAAINGYEKAADLSIDAMNLARANADSWAERIALSNAVEFLTYLNRFDETRELLDRWNNIKGDETNRRLSHYLQACTEVFLKQGKLPEARGYCEQALQKAEADSNYDMVPYCTKLLSKIHEALGDFETALALYKHYHVLEQRYQGELVKRRARVAEIHYQSEALRKQAEDARLRAEQSEKDASTDPLTGLANRRSFDVFVDNILREGRTDIAVLFLDLDHFKKINDRFSHNIGDEVLKRFAHLLAGCCRQDDLVSRFGGEEFVVLLSGVTAQTASATGERILDETRLFDWSQLEPDLTVTASAGLALGHEGTDRSSLLSLADARLYEAKTAGRDRLVTTGS